MVMTQPAVHVVFRRSAAGQMDCGGIGKGRSAQILDMHFPADRNSKVPHLKAFCQPAQAVRLDLEPRAGVGFPRAQVVIERMQTFIQQHRLAHIAGDIGALFQSLAGLFDPASGIGNGVQDLKRHTRHPGAVDIVGDEFRWQ